MRISAVIVKILTDNIPVSWMNESYGDHLHMLELVGTVYHDVDRGSKWKGASASGPANINIYHINININ